MCEVAKAAVVAFGGTERDRGSRTRSRLETPVKGGGACTPPWSGSLVVSCGYLDSGRSGVAGEEGRVHGVV